MQKSGHFHLSKFYKGQQAKIGLKSEELKGQLCCAIENVYDDQQSIFHFSS